ncbi:tRNA lysidine(34) synthetase TilS [Thioalkalicoccus limnaeus]|uniref:tRNA(Ile)-lysidine synthase n=1 Tax=Thioalkalicoccus limnaeus TaxID=120681 RepID=A0ABV4B9L2_9GAMM
MPRLVPDHLLGAIGPFATGRRGWVAFSGGMDSTVLLAALAQLRERLPFRLHAAHVDHGLQPASAAWSDHCRRLCDDLEVPLTCLSVDARAAPGESPEAAARTARYAALMGLIAPGDRLFTAHHQDDQAETVLLALMRGSGPHGLAAMPALAPFGAGLLARPLLGYRRADLEAFARAAGLVWIEDPTNAVLDLDRNLLRHQVLPLLRRRWPSLAHTIARSAAHCADAARLLDGQAAEQIERLALAGGAALSVRGLCALPAELGRTTVRYWIRSHGRTVPDQVHLERILTEVANARPDATPLVAWPGVEIRRYRDALFLLSPLPPAPEPGARIPWIGPALALPHGLGSLARSPSEPGAASAPLEVRFRVPGARWRPAPGAPSRALKILFQEVGIPPWLRPYVPLIHAGGELLAVAGVTPSAGVIWSGHPWEDLGLFR